MLPFLTRRKAQVRLPEAGVLVLNECLGLTEFRSVEKLRVVTVPAYYVFAAGCGTECRLRVARAPEKRLPVVGQKRPPRRIASRGRKVCERYGGGRCRHAAIST